MEKLPSHITKLVTELEKRGISHTVKSGVADGEPFHTIIIPHPSNVRTILTGKKEKRPALRGEGGLIEAITKTSREPQYLGVMLQEDQLTDKIKPIISHALKDHEQNLNVHVTSGISKDSLREALARSAPEFHHVSDLDLPRETIVVIRRTRPKLV